MYSLGAVPKNIANWVCDTNCSVNCSVFWSGKVNDLCPFFCGLPYVGWEDQEVMCLFNYFLVPFQWFYKWSNKYQASKIVKWHKGHYDCWGASREGVNSRFFNLVFSLPILGSFVPLFLAELRTLMNRVNHHIRTEGCTQHLNYQCPHHSFYLICVWHSYAQGFNSEKSEGKSLAIKKWMKAPSATAHTFWDNLTQGQKKKSNTL